MSVDHLRNRCRAIDRFIHRLVELELPLPDDGSPDGEWLALRWSETGVTFCFEPDSEEHGVIDEFDAAILNGVDRPTGRTQLPGDNRNTCYRRTSSDCPLPPLASLT